MSVGELKRKLQVYNDNADIVLASDCIFGTAINQNFSLQTNDGDDNSPVFIEFSLKNMVIPIKKEDGLWKIKDIQVK
jgi:hypothetical protein